MFSTSRLSDEPGRYAVVVEACLPLLGGLLLPWKPGPDAGQGVKGRPPPIAFGIIWFSIAVLWFFALFLTALNLDDTHVILISVFSLFAMLGCVAWLIYWKRGERVHANYVLMFTFLMSNMVLVSAITAWSVVNLYAVTTVALLFVPLATWTGLATVLGLLDLQM